MYLVSVIVPVYNTEIYVRQTILSVIHQTIGFEQNIELILVNNATEDGADAICEEFLKKYPSNVKKLVLAKNRGPSGARNIGLEAATGKYINYLDSDDLWEEDALEILVDVLERNSGRIELAVGRVRHFDARNEWHFLDWKFQMADEKIVDIYREPEYVHLHLGSALLLADAARRYPHDEQVYNAEDMQYFNKILLHTGKYALCTKAVYLYRTRPSGNSTLQNAHKSIRWYVNTVQRVYQYLFDYSRSKYGYVIPYLQYLIMHELQWRIDKDVECDGVDEEWYRNAIAKLLRDIDDDIILKGKVLWKERKIYALCLKRQFPLGTNNAENLFRKYFKVDEGLYLKAVQYFNGKLHIVGFLRYPYQINGRLYLKCGSEETEITFNGENSDTDVKGLGQLIAHGKTFFISYSMGDGMTCLFRLMADEISHILRINCFRNTLFDEGNLSVTDYEIMVHKS
ncbi:MAG: glycosyltransferase family 2 protein [Lachnospiraceae bacterium]|nr:glycosyltransferase family 2 protein [Lachnospiraceae bacterium]